MCIHFLINFIDKKNFIEDQDNHLSNYILFFTK